MQKLIAINKHVSNYPAAITFQKGDRISLGKKHAEFEGWIWVTTEDTHSGWAPMRYLDVISDDTAIAKQDYCAVELNVNAGDELVLQYVVDGWGWVEATDGSCVWVPMKITQNK